jgi:signal transduction histidine kinase
MSLTAALLAISILLQLMVIGFAIRQVMWRRQAPLAWALVAAAFVLMLTRRVLTFASILGVGFQPLTPLEAEWVGISVSLLILSAMSLLNPLLERGRKAEATLKAQVLEQARQAEALKEAVQVRDTFLSVASHELKTPLTPMTLRIQALAKVADSQPVSPFVHQVREVADTALRQITKLSSLVNDLLDVSRIETGHLSITWQQVDLADVIRQVASRFGAEAERAGSPLEAKVPAQLLVRSDEMRLEQLVTNLVDNAIKYGDGKPIQLQLITDSDKAVFQVIDHGIGISPEHLTRIFGRFERAVSERNYGGLGLGLYISKTVVDALGGSIHVVSAPGQGATFTVELPVKSPLLS